LEKAGLLGPGRVFARNHLVVIAQRRSGAKVRSLADLAKPGVRLVLAAPAVPAGNYARQALATLDASGVFGRGFAARALGNLVSEETSVRQVALKVQLGEADAGFVYATDVTPALRGAVNVVLLPTAARQAVAYVIGSFRGSREGSRFVAFVLSSEGQKVLRRLGFSPP
jgi:molybdate transport system substrate-binding protein